MTLPPVRSVGNSNHVADHNSIVAEAWARLPVFNVKDPTYGAVGNDSTNDATAIQSAITAAQTAGGGVVYFPAAKYAISSTLNVTDSNVMLQGAGGDVSHNVGGIDNFGTQLRWTGAAGGTMVKFASPTGGTEQTRFGGGVQDIVFHSNYGGTAAGIGLHVNTWWSGDFRRLYLYEFSTTAILVDVSTGGGEQRSTQGCTFHGITGRQRVAGGSFVKLDGTTAANASLNLFEHMDVSFAGLTNIGAYALYCCDANVFVRCRANVSAPGDAVVFHAVGAGGFGAGDNMFIAFTSEPTALIKMKGTEEAANPSLNNQMLLLDSGNATPTPTLGTTATGFWSFTNSTSRMRNVNVAMGANVAEADLALAAVPSTTSLYLRNGSGDHLRFDDGTYKWKIATNGSTLLLVGLAGATTYVEVGSGLKVAGGSGFNGTTPIGQPAAYTQTYATTTRTHPALTSSAAPAGGTGTAAGGWDTAANRDAAITTINALRTDVTNLKNLVNQILDDLQAYGLLQ